MSTRQPEQENLFFDVKKTAKKLEKRYQKLSYRAHDEAKTVERIAYLSFIFILIRVVYVIFSVISSELIESFIFQPGRNKDVIPKIEIYGLLFEGIIIILIIVQNCIAKWAVHKGSRQSAKFSVIISVTFMIAYVALLTGQYYLACLKFDVKAKQNIQSSAHTLTNQNQVNDTIFGLQRGVGLLFFTLVSILCCFMFLFTCFFVTLQYYKFFVTVKEQEQMKVRLPFVVKRVDHKKGVVKA